MSRKGLNLATPINLDIRIALRTGGHFFDGPDTPLFVLTGDAYTGLPKRNLEAYEED